MDDRSSRGEGHESRRRPEPRGEGRTSPRRETAGREQRRDRHSSDPASTRSEPRPRWQEGHEHEQESQRRPHGRSEQSPDRSRASAPPAERRTGTPDTHGGEAGGRTGSPVEEGLDRQRRRTERGGRGQERERSTSTDRRDASVGRSDRERLEGEDHDPRGRREIPHYVGEDDVRTQERSGGGLTHEQQQRRDEPTTWTEGDAERREERGVERDQPRAHAQQPGQRESTDAGDDRRNRRHVHEGDQGDDGTRHDHYRDE
ncbi:hypothetical protein B1756_00640 [Natrarchaeobaculum aegyptiacum]|uniref:Uncharacterized protein n=1 Tax=Natrarchaeobaculum aegyptiacum TaxID=745377 RepID=A0A2Z2HQW6_9EURY|nr:hypothetical protein B1756_00640 [Natrarchaeobaculum aegyptiacum]